MGDERNGSKNGKLEGLTRRDVLKGIAISAGVVAVGAITGANPIGAARAAGTCPGTTPKATLQYQTQPKGKDHCSVCANFIAPHCCKVVAGQISPEGWCMAFTPKTA